MGMSAPVATVAKTLTTLTHAMQHVVLINPRNAQTLTLVTQLDLYWRNLHCQTGMRLVGY
jgi:hypothetical protein